MPTWKQNRDPLYRGDAATVSPPTSTADASVVRHILYLEGYGRETPYLSTTEDRQTAEYFAGRDGAVWRTKDPAGNNSSDRGRRCACPEPTIR